MERSYQLTSRLLGNERTIHLRVPASEPRALAVFLDAELYRERIGAPAIVDDLEIRGGIVSTLAVFVGMIRTEVRRRECTTRGTFGRFLEQELLPSVRELYSMLRDVEAKVLVGVSLSGLAAAQAAVDVPGVFDCVIAQSGSFWWDDSRLPRWVARKPAPPEALRARFYLDVGIEESESAGVRHRDGVVQAVSQIEGVRQMREALRLAGYAVRYEEFPGGHSFAAWAKALPLALRWALAPKGRP